MGQDNSRVRLTVGRVAAFACPEGKSQAFLWDTEAPSLMLRVTPTGRKTYAFEGRLNGSTLRVGIGTATDWTLDAARKRAVELKQLVDNGQDPRELERQKVAAAVARKVEEAAQVEADRLADVTVGAVWEIYVAERREHWGERHYADHLKMAKAGGELAKRGVKLLKSGERPRTLAGPVFSLLGTPLRELTSTRIEAWATEQAKTRPTYARLCWRCLKVFLNWCAEHAEYSQLLSTTNPAKTKKAREALGKAAVKDDALQREQLSVWFAAVCNIQNPVIAAYLQTLLLTGARPGEVLTLRWEDLNTQWKGMTIRDKVEGERVIPLTPYVAHILAKLPRRNEWVFSSTRALSLDPASIKRRQAKHVRKGSVAPTGVLVQASVSGHLTDPSSAHRCVCAAVGLEGLTLHGLRRSFASLTEWLEIPSGVVAQIQGHKPSATAEKHYKRRPLDLLRVHHERIEAWVLEQAGVSFNALKTEGGTPKLVKAV
ncbi:tyrosine-type recombinase/integrase [Roseateles oligotrophus]|uniref:Integrase family protein n=1 Tax=Roseateles oligotrophus TaxID=1769250 RepID=A0ABT2YIZ0_9BURK|nr:integrase family protein [Roseateles oligotrophus]MCV2370005.1 integrase family protein [Roseateles oligotrophus]